MPVTPPAVCRPIRFSARLRAPLLLLLGVCAGFAAAPPVALERLQLSAAGAPGAVTLQPVLRGEIKEVTVDLLSLSGPARHSEPATTDHETVWLVLAGRATLQARGQRYDIEGETIARAPAGWDCRFDVPAGAVLHVLRIQRALTAADRVELRKFASHNAAPHVKKFSECPAYREAIKSPKTTSRTLLPENYVPRMAVGTVQTTGPDTVGAHRHPMLEQLFLGLRGNDITVTADDSRAHLAEFTILHIPLGSNHGAEVSTGHQLHYVWMDFFAAKEGQEWLKMHQPLDPGKKP